MALNDKQRNQFNTICARIAGGESLRKACRRQNAPHKATVLRWLDAEGAQELRDQYARARGEQADFYADEIIDIADDESLDPNSRRIMIDARKWVAGKLRPKVYGDKLALGGADDLPAIRQEVREQADAFTSGIAGMVALGKAGKRDIRH